MYLELPNYSDQFIDSFVNYMMTKHLNEIYDNNIYELLKKEYGSELKKVFTVDKKTLIKNLIIENYSETNFYTQIISLTCKDRDTIKEYLQKNLGIYNKELITKIQLNKFSDYKQQEWFEDFLSDADFLINQKNKNLQQTVEILCGESLERYSDYFRKLVLLPPEFMEIYRVYRNACQEISHLKNERRWGCKKRKYEIHKMKEKIEYLKKSIHQDLSNDNIKIILEKIEHLKNKRWGGKKEKNENNINFQVSNDYKLNEKIEYLKNGIYEKLHYYEIHKICEKIEHLKNKRWRRKFFHRSMFEDIKKLYDLSSDIEVDGKMEKINTYMVNNFITSSTMGLIVCPYCNRDYINSRDGMLGCQMDHFYSRKKYPLFSISLFNFIPSCGTCNWLKDTKDLKINPYIKELHDRHRVVFDISRSINDSYQISFKQIINQEIIDNIDEDLENDLNDCLKLEKAYEIHSVDIERMIKREQEYGDENRDFLKELFSKTFSSTEIDKKIDELIYGDVVFLDEDELVNISLGKLTKDAYNKIKSWKS